MKLTNLFQLLNSLDGFENKVAYRNFPINEAPELPFICYLVTDTDNFLADGKVFKIISNIDIELYTSNKDETSEKIVEDALFENDITWNKDEDYLEDEHCYLITYNITLVVEGD